VDEATVRAVLTQHFEQGASDPDLAHAMYHHDAVLEFPQSGERFVGVANMRDWRAADPASVATEIRRVRGEGDLWVAEIAISYDGAEWNRGVTILAFRDGRIACETIYVTEAWEAPEWRAEWRAAP
jgi:SnoaL-like domain